MTTVAEVLVDLVDGRVFEHGWQSWSPTTTYPVTATSHRPSGPALQTMCWRPGCPGPACGFQGEGLLAVDPGADEPAHLFAAREGLADVPSIRAELRGDRLVVSTDGSADGIEHVVAPGPLTAGLAGWADRFARQAGVGSLRPAPTVWCSWYAYFGDVTEADVLANMEAIEELGLPVEVIQIDDGWQAEIGDWLEPSPRFRSLPGLVARIRDAGHRAGVWVAPFLVGARSELARDRPEWLVADADAGHNWGQRLFALDVTHPGAAAYLHRVFTGLRASGVDYYKLDFTYAGAMLGHRHSDVPALTAYRNGLRLIRDAVGPDAFLVGCGGPILPSVGSVDAFRIAPDIDVRVEPVHGDLSRPSFRAAALSVVGRAWQHGRFWVNDADCVLARPAASHREEWAGLVERFGGLRASGDRILDLDDWGRETTRRLLTGVPPPTPFTIQGEEGPP